MRRHEIYCPSSQIVAHFTSDVLREHPFDSHIDCSQSRLRRVQRVPKVLTQLLRNYCSDTAVVLYSTEFKIQIKLFQRIFASVFGVRLETDGDWVYKFLLFSRRLKYNFVHTIYRRFSGNVCNLLLFCSRFYDYSYGRVLAVLYATLRRMKFHLWTQIVCMREKERERPSEISIAFCCLSPGL